MIIYKPSDRILLKIGDISLKVSPLTALQKANLMSLTKMSAGREVADTSMMAIMTIKYSVKEIYGVDATFADGTEFSLSYDPDGTLSEESLTAIMQILDNGTLTQIAAQLLTTGVQSIKVPGVEVDAGKSVEVKKKSAS